MAANREVVQRRAFAKGFTRNFSVFLDDVVAFLMHELTETATPELLPNNNLRDVCNNDFRLAVVKSNFSRHSHRFALVLLRIREVPGAGGWNKGGDDLIRVLAAQVQENVASPGLVNAVHFVCYGCDFADMLGRFGSRVNCQGLCNGCGGEGADEQS